MKQLLLLLVMSTILLSAHAQPTDKRLQRRLSEMFRDYPGSIGIYVHDLKKNKIVAINADTVFPTASMVKIPILTGIMHKLESGELNYHQTLTYRDSLLYEGVDILGSFKNNEKIELSKLMMLMLTMSDNTASLWLQSLAGTGTRINELMDSLGMRYTRVNSRTPGRENNRAEYGWGQTTPLEMATLMEKIVRKEVINAAASEKMLRLLGRNYWDEVAVSAIPADAFVASKNGAVNATRNEVVFVNAKKSRYLFCICTKNNKDTSWEPGNAAWVLTRAVSALLWKYYN
ncbi:serine hydrolase [Sediminibacterium soli]|uniref:serine hydrolase n=1 Tax=Sediminibacterium soli TaxID=2698829 RepID=UPI00137970AA|nr:serine hydrolase [Sediminibacterium soli]NCI47823.1 serine hydrolase [Sediminibacterium soli]